MLNVFITVDTEVTPKTPNWRETRLETDARRDLWGETADGEFGLGYQLRLLREHNLKASFFVEPLFAELSGAASLSNLVHTIQSAGQEVQAHLHSEWLADLGLRILDGREGENLFDFSEDDQTRLLAFALDRLRAAGAEHLCAFRAGNYGADNRTLRALARNGIRYDTSYNPCFTKGSQPACRVVSPEVLLQPRALDGVIEFPISFIQDWPGHQRHAQLTALSWREMKRALELAHQRGWYSFVIVSHSFELIAGRDSGDAPAPDAMVIDRFQQLCGYLDRERDRFSTRFFKDVDPAEIPTSMVPRAPLASSMFLTAQRIREQYVRRRTVRQRRQAAAARAPQA